MLNILICDDEIAFINKITKMIHQFLFSGKYAAIDYHINSFTNAEKCMEFCRSNTLHIAFIDIDMPVYNGFDIAACLNKQEENVMIVFVSNLDNYVYSSLRFHPFRFIRKHKLEEEIEETMHAALFEIVFSKQFIELKNSNSKDKILLSDIAFFECRKNYVEISTVYNTKHLYRSTLKELEEQYRKYFFIRVHAAYIVNAAHIKKLNGSTVQMKSGAEIPISRKYCKDVHQAYLNYLRK